MKRTKYYYLTAIFIIKSVFAFGQDIKIEVPNFNDKYSNYVKQLEEGKLDIDYVDFRNSYLESKQFSKKKYKL